MLVDRDNQIAALKKARGELRKVYKNTQRNLERERATHDSLLREINAAPKLTGQACPCTKLELCQGERDKFRAQWLREKNAADVIGDVGLESIQKAEERDELKAQLGAAMSGEQGELLQGQQEEIAELRKLNIQLTAQRDAAQAEASKSIPHRDRAHAKISELGTQLQEAKATASSLKEWNVKLAVRKDAYMDKYTESQRKLARANRETKILQSTISSLATALSEERRAHGELPAETERSCETCKWEVGRKGCLVGGWLTCRLNNFPAWEPKDALANSCDTCRYGAPTSMCPKGEPQCDTTNGNYKWKPKG
jgi:hypothetical protein